MSGGKTDAHRRPARPPLLHQRFQPFQRKRQVRAAFVVCHGVDFIHNHGLNMAQEGTAFFRGQQDVKRLRGGNQDVGRMRQHRPAFRRERVAGAHRRADGRHRQASRSGQRGDLTERHFQILANVVAQCLERRNINDFGTVLEGAAQGLANQAVDAGKKRRQRLAGAGGRANECGLTREYGWPSPLLRFRGRAEPGREPFLDERVRPGQEKQGTSAVCSSTPKSTS